MTSVHSKMYSIPHPMPAPVLTALIAITSIVTYLQVLDPTAVVLCTLYSIEELECRNPVLTWFCANSDGGGRRQTTQD